MLQPNFAQCRSQLLRFKSIQAKRTRACKAGTSRLDLANVDGEAKPAATHISAMDTPLDNALDEETSLVECARTPVGQCRPKEE